MYSANTLQVNFLIKNVISFIKQEEYIDIEVTTQSEVAFTINEYRKEFYASYDKHDKEKRISHNHSKVPTVYCASKFRNILDIHLLIAFSSDHELKYITSGIQQHFVTSLGACIAYQAHRAFSEYLRDSGKISALAKRVESIASLIPEIFHLLISLGKYSPLHISPFTIV